MSRLVFCDLHVSVPFMLKKHETGGGGITRLCSPQVLLLVLCIFPIGGYLKALPTTADSILHSSDISCPFA
jgi:hypothetical protein